MTADHTLEGRVNFTNSNKLERAAHPLWKERAEAWAEGHISRSSSWMWPP